LLKGIGIGVGHKADCQGNKAKANASEVKMLRMVNISSEHVDEKSRDVSNNAHSQLDEENIIEDITLGRGDGGKLSRSLTQIVIPADPNHPPYPPSNFISYKLIPCPKSFLLSVC